MRPVNLIPPEERRGDRAPLRTGALPYAIVAVLALALIGVTAVTLIGNQIKDREAEIAALETREAEATAQAEALRPYAEFAALSEARDATVTSLAQSRFDWERVLRELALVMPENIWLTAVTGTVSPTVALEGATTVDGRSEVQGPALELVGCGDDHEAVAGFVAALRDIDGVTRVGIASSERPEATTDSSTSPTTDSASPGSSDDCRTRDFIARFEIVAAFDAVPVPAAAEAAPAAPAVPAEGEAPAATESGEEVADALTEQQRARDSASEQTDEAKEATNLIPGVTR